MKYFFYIIFFSAFSLFSQMKENKLNDRLSDLNHSFSLTYEAFMGYSILEGTEYFEDEIVNTSLIEDETYIFGFGLRYALSMELSQNNYKNLPFLGIGSEVFFDFILDYQYSDFSREAFTFGVIPHIRFLYFLKAGYGFGFINFREYTDFYGGESNVYNLHQGIQFYHFGFDFPVTDRTYANASLDIAENNMQFLQKWEIIRFRLGFTFRF